MAAAWLHPADGSEAIARNLCEAMCEYSRSTSQGSLTTSPHGAMLVNSGVNYAVFNAAILNRRLEGGSDALETFLRHASNHYRTLRTAWSCWLCDDLLAADLRGQARGILGRHGLRCIAEHQGMLAESLTATSRAMPRLSYRQVRDQQTRKDFHQIVSRVFALPGGIARQIYGAEPFWNGSYIGWVGYSEGRPVTTAATESAAGAVGLYSVATVPEAQGKGYAEAITRHSLQQAHLASGLARSVLQSTPAGLPLYQRIGYRKLTAVKVYVAS